MNTYIVTIGFAPWQTLEATFKQVYKTIGIKPTRHILLDNGYPKDKHYNSWMLHTVCDTYEVEYYNLGENLGLAAGYNWLINKCQAKDEDIIIGVDPDVWPIDQGWGEALQGVLAADETIGWASLNVVPHTAREMIERGGKQLMVGDYVVQECPAACLNSICAWRPKMLKAVGGLAEPRKFYGGVESHMKPRLDLVKYRWVFLMDYREEFNEAVDSQPDYKQYKRDYVDGKTKDSFEVWLQGDQPHISRQK